MVFFALILSVLYGLIFFDFVSILTRDPVELLGLMFLVFELFIFIIAAAPGAMEWLLYISGYEDTENVLMSIALLLIVKERIEDGANEKAVLSYSITALSFASISIFPG